ncbi:hypothetical protein HETIRDRAFT_440177, partial [Heterobasidion irregulare TC 32-1]
ARLPTPIHPTPHVRLLHLLQAERVRGLSQRPSFTLVRHAGPALLLWPEWRPVSDPVVLQLLILFVLPKRHPREC